MDENSQGKMMVPVKIYGAEGIDEWEISGYLSEFCLTDVAISIVVIVFENLNSLKHKPTQLFPFSPISWITKIKAIERYHERQSEDNARYLGTAAYS